MLQPFSTRRSLAHSIISSVLKNETIIETPEDVDGVLELCQVLVKDQLDSAAQGNQVRRQGLSNIDRDEMAEEQGWVARMVHLFRAESLDIQFEVRLMRPEGNIAIDLLLIHCYSFYKQRGVISKSVVNGYGIPTQRSSQTPSNYVEGTNSENRT